MTWLGTWAKRKAIKYGTVFPGSNLTDFSLLIKTAADRNIGLELHTASRLAATLADGTTTVGLGRILDANSGAIDLNPTATAGGNGLFLFANPLLDGDSVLAINGSGTLPSPLVDGTTYYVVGVLGSDGNHFQLAVTPGGTPITMTTAGSGSWVIRYYNQSLILRTLFPVLASASTGDVMGYIYYDHTQTDQENKAAAVDADTAIYMPMEDSPTGSAGDIVDWTANANNGSSAGSMGAAIAGQVGNGLDFDGSDDRVVFTAVDVSGGTIHYSCIFRPSATPDEFTACLIHNKRTMLSYDLSEIRWWPDTATTVVNAACSLSLGTKYQVDVFQTGTSYSIFLNGSLLQSGTTAAISNATEGHNFGSFSQSEWFHQGLLDEPKIRLASPSSPADWAAYNYANQFTNSDTVTIGDEESYSPTNTFTATASLTIGVATTSIAATFAGGTHTAITSLVVNHAALAATTTFVAPNYTATAALITNHAALAASATFASGTHIATAALTTNHAALAASATFAGGTHTATAALITNHAAIAVSTTFVSPSYNATTSLVVNHATLVGAGIFATSVFSASAVLTAGHASLAANAELTFPTRTATAALTTNHATLVASATFVSPSYNANGSLIVGTTLFSGLSDVSAPIYTVTAALLVPHAVFAGNIVATIPAGAFDYIIGDFLVYHDAIGDLVTYRDVIGELGTVMQ